MVHPASDALLESSPARKSRLRWLAEAFSFPVMCVFVLAAAIFAYCPRGIDEPDVWWHMEDANYLFQHHAFPRFDTYTFAGVGTPWLNQQWLSEIPYLVGFRSMGLRGTLLVYFLVSVLIFACVYYRCCRAGADCKDAAVATLGALCFGGVSLAPRTLLFGWLCLSGLMLVVDHFRRTGRGLWLLPPLFALWINLHGSWVFGMVIMALVVLSGLIEGQWGSLVARRWSGAELRKLVIAMGASVGALFLNPFGYELVLYPKFLLAHQQAVMQNIEEWQPVHFNTWNGQLAFLLILLLFAALLFSRRQWQLLDVLLIGFALWAALSHARFMFFAGVMIAPILAPSLNLFPPYERELDKPWLNAAVMAGIVAAMIYSYPTAGKLQKQVDARFPRSALAFMQRHGLSGRIFNQYGWGGYMGWNTPDLKPGIDGRADVFVYNGVFKDFLGATALKGSYATLDKYRIDYVLVRPEEPLAYLLDHSPTWNVIYADKVAVLLERIPALPATVDNAN